MATRATVTARYRHFTLQSAFSACSAAKSLAAALGLFAAFGGVSQAHAVTRYVNASLVTGANDGTSWENAHQGAGGLAAALAAAGAGDQVWTAAGVYKPTLTTTRSLYFNLETGVQVYGGFAGDETLLTERDFVANLTTLTGDLLGNDGPPGSFTNNADNSFHIVNGASANSTAILDGFTVTAGNANGNGGLDQDKGGGIIFLTTSNATIRNCIIQYNRCTFGGGAVYIRQSSPTFTDVRMNNNQGGSFGGAIDMANFCNPNFNRVQFIGNTAARAGGVEVFGSSNPTIYNCLFRGNTATGASGGGAMWIGSTSSAALRDCTIVGNSATVTVGGILNSASTTTIHNTIIWGNTGPGGGTAGQQLSGGTNTVSYSDVQNGFAGTGNINANPLFVNQAAGDLRLAAGSPCIDAGNNAVVPPAVNQDLDHNPRFVDDPATTDTGAGTAPLVDMGAYEFLPAPPKCPADIDGSGAVNVDDLLAVINAWGAGGANPADVNGDLIVNVDDLLAVIGAWGACP